MSVSLEYRDLIYIILEKGLQTGDKISEESRERGNQFIRMLIEELNKVGKNKSADKNINLRIAALIFVGMCTWVSLWFKPKNKTEKKEVTDLVAKFYSRGFLK